MTPKWVKINKKHVWQVDFKSPIRYLTPKLMSGWARHWLLALCPPVSWCICLIVDLARLSLECVLLGVFPLDAIMVPSHQRYLDAGLTSVIIDDAFVHQLKQFQKGCEVLSETVKTRLRCFLSGQVSAIHGHPECLMSKTILNILKGCFCNSIFCIVTNFSNIQIFVQPSP